MPIAFFLMTAHFTERFDHHRGKLPLLRRTSPLRTLIFMAITFAGFLLINAFWLYLSGGRWISFHPAGYWHDLVQPLGETFLTPLSVITHKWMIAVAGLTLGLMVFVPIIMSVLYRLTWSVPAVVIVALIGHAPILALTLALGCVLAGRTPLRSDMPFVAMVLGFLPPGLYLMLFSFLGSESAALPVEQLLLKAPLLAALVAAVLSGAAVLSLARLSDYRSGVVWPVVTFLVAAPMLLFFLLVGSDELEYNLLTAGLSPTDTLLEPLPLKDWRERNHIPDLPAKDLLGKVQDDLRFQKSQLGQRCDRFLEDHKKSDRAAAVLWVRAQVVSLVVDAQALAGGQVRYDASYVRGESAPSWASLAEEFGSRPQAALAQWHLGELALREGKIPDALTRLRDCDQKLDKLLARRHREKTPSPADLNPFAGSALVPRQVYYQIAQTQAEQLLWVIDQVHAEHDALSAQALRDWQRLDLSAPDYAVQLNKLLASCFNTNMADVLRLALAQTDHDMDRRMTILGALAAQPNSPAFVQANFELGELTLRLTKPHAGLKTAKEYFQTVADAGDNPWQDQAQQRLASLTAPKEQP
jgi:hypothetical protein